MVCLISLTNAGKMIWYRSKCIKGIKIRDEEFAKYYNWLSTGFLNHGGTVTQWNTVQFLRPSAIGHPPSLPVTCPLSPVTSSHLFQRRINILYRTFTGAVGANVNHGSIASDFTNQERKIFFLFRTHEMANR
jgi:hypothetical protein